VHSIAAVQTEYSLWSRHVEAEILPTCRELGIGFVPYSPLGRGFLTGRYQASQDFAPDDFRSQLPRFSDAAFTTNHRIVNVISAMAKDKGCTTPQLAIAWLLAKGDDIVPIPGTKRLKYLEENVAAGDVILTNEECATSEASVDGLPVVGERYTAEGMKGLNA